MAPFLPVMLHKQIKGDEPSPLGARPTVKRRNVGDCGFSTGSSYEVWHLALAGALTWAGSRHTHPTPSFLMHIIIFRMYLI